MRISLGETVFLIKKASGTKFSRHKKTWYDLETNKQTKSKLI